MQIKTKNGEVIYQDDSPNMRIMLENLLYKRKNGEIISLRHANFLNENLSGLLFKDIDLRGAHFEKCDLSNVQFMGCNLEGVDFKQCDIINSFFRENLMRFTDFVLCRMDGIVFTSNDKMNVCFSLCSLRNSDFLNQNLDYIKFDSCIICFSKFPKIIKLSRFYNCDLNDVVGPQEVQREDIATLMLNQKQPLIAYKVVNELGTGPYFGKIRYEVGKEINETNYNSDIFRECGAGINLATLEWCKGLAAISPEYSILECEFMPEDIVAIPINNKGKFRVKRCKVIRKYEGE